MDLVAVCVPDLLAIVENDRNGPVGMPLTAAKRLAFARGEDIRLTYRVTDRSGCSIDLSTGLSAFSWEVLDALDGPVALLVPGTILEPPQNARVQVLLSSMQTKDMYARNATHRMFYRAWLSRDGSKHQVVPTSPLDLLHSNAP